MKLINPFHVIADVTDPDTFANIVAFPVVKPFQLLGDLFDKLMDHRNPLISAFGFIGGLLLIPFSFAVIAIYAIITLPLTLAYSALHGVIRFTLRWLKYGIICFIVLSFAKWMGWF